MRWIGKGDLASDFTDRDWLSVREMEAWIFGYIFIGVCLEKINGERR